MVIDAPADPLAPRRLPRILLGFFAAWWLLLAIAPRYREDWLLENLLVAAALPVAWRIHRLLPDSALLALFAFFCLHALGAHYTYSEVPYDAWSTALSGHSISELAGFERNHYDRLVHFAYGLLVTPAAVALIDARVAPRGLWRWLLPFCFMASHGAVYETIEWAAAAILGGDLGQAYVGTQGDVWDAQKDMALALLGSAIALLWIRCRG
jgi:putative membrane protein